jgi:hypothetical protein
LRVLLVCGSMTRKISPAQTKRTLKGPIFISLGIGAVFRVALPAFSKLDRGKRFVEVHGLNR